MTYRGYEEKTMTLTLTHSNKQPAFIKELDGAILTEVEQGSSWKDYKLTEGTVYTWKQDKKSEFGQVVNGDLVVMTMDEAVAAVNAAVNAAEGVEQTSEVAEIEETEVKKAPYEKTYAEIEITCESLNGKKVSMSATSDTVRFERIYKNIAGLMENLDKVQNLSVKAYDNQYIAHEIALEQAIEEIKKIERNK